MRHKKTMLACLIVVGIAIIAIMAYLPKSDEIQKALPPGSRIYKVYRSGGWGNGDFVYALKASMSLQEYLNFVNNLGLASDIVDPFSVIGYNSSVDDLPGSERKGWDEPSQSRLKYYRMSQRSFIRASYDNGYLYYYTRGW